MTDLRQIPYYPMYTCTKSYRDLPAAHRAPNHDGHCRLLHGHNFGFDITFSAEQLDENGFVIDVGKLGWLKEFMAKTFDHTLLLNESDPYLAVLCESLMRPGHDPEMPPPFAKIVVVPSCSMEGLAQYVFETVNDLIDGTEPSTARSLCVTKVVCLEDSKNVAAYE